MEKFVKDRDLLSSLLVCSMDPASVCDLFEESVQISHNDITIALNPGEVDEPQEANQVLLGKIISRHRLGKAAIQGSLKLSWNAIKGWKWNEIESGIIQFTFANRADALNVLARRPWFVCGALLVIMPWPAWLSPAEVRFDKTPIWVRIESIPPFYWNLSNLKELASKASPVYELPPGIEDAVGMSNLRFRATIDIDKPIFSGFFLRRQRLKDLWIQYKYERLPKLCFKCGVLTHDQSTCFKSPTIIKDANGNVYPMFGVWLKSDSHERSTFSSPLAKWFHDWVLQKKLFHDSTLRNQVKIHKAIQNGEAAEIRECRRQLPGKKRIVSDNDEGSGEPNSDLVITQMPLVYLPGIGEIAPFGNNSKSVSILDLQEAAEKYAAAKACNSGDEVSPTILAQEEAMARTENISSLGETNMHHIVYNNPITPIENPVGEKPKTLQSKSLPVVPINSDVSLGDSSNQANELLGSQAQLVKWPSKECWADPKARELLMGALTIDKYHREPTLFNPICDIEDFRVHEHLDGPRKRKALDGIIFSPNPSPDPTQKTSTRMHNVDNTGSPTPEEVQDAPDFQSNISKNLIPEELKVATFSPGSNYNPKVNLWQRKGKEALQTVLAAMGPRKRRGRPPKTQPPLAATPKLFKGGRKAKGSTGGKATSGTQWHDRTFDLKVNLDNHFVIIEKKQKEKPNSVPSVGLSGGLGMCWMKGISCNIQVSFKYSIIGEISSDPPGIPWILVGTYGPPNSVDKELFWHKMGDYTLKTTRPILFLGDMNGTLRDSECFHYHGSVSRYSFDFRRMVDRAGLIDLGFQGPAFTWVKGSTNPRVGVAMKRTRLDRGLASSEWRILFPQAIINHLAASESDHRPLLLDIMGGANCKGR
ncbi:hypothetical protein F8388_009527 [Cannabis sativa]|uniref:DUF4283 domain-containing protein n=1 Tax=Cannabis sativa TaxID=3483 RepID=A0A7J6DWC7_CANSA|nr:hypothetical protein G4B88_015872 [Cannabis sativa]KAF4391105.1 hypothetical protein F8388_009527 [Cannabis sativa]